MKTLRFESIIHAPRAEVWEAMLGPETYRLWTAAFSEGSYYEGSWETGARIQFLGPDGNGMVSVIAESRPGEFLSIQHLGMIKDGIEDTTSDQVKAWAGAFENYSFSDSGTSTRLEVTLDVTSDFEDYMNRTWPKALAVLKDLCETSSR